MQSRQQNTCKYTRTHTHTCIYKLCEAQEGKTFTLFFIFLTFWTLHTIETGSSKYK